MLYRALGSRPFGEQLQLSERGEPLLGEKRYVELDGLRCPVCSSAMVGSRNQFKRAPDSALVFADSYCQKCGSTWEDRYTLIGYSNLEEGLCTN